MDRYKSRLLIIIIILLMFIYSINNLAADEKDRFLSQRQSMVREQIEGRGITDKRVLRAMLSVRRDEFVSRFLKPFAYMDSPLPIGYEQTISQPYIVALMTESLELRPQDKVLEIGTGSGYQAAILAEIVKEVYTIEIIPGLYNKAKDTLESLGYKNIKLRCADGYKGWPEAGPFDAIIVTCAPEEIPAPLLEQLKEGARMVIPLGETRGIQELVLIRKKDNAFVKTVITGCSFVPMLGIAQQIKH